MQDRFRFRVWDSDNDVFDYIDLTDIKKTIKILDSYESYFWSDYFKDKPEYIMQCTGLKDESGKLIYEGDIVKTLYTRPDGVVINRNCVVEFNRCAFWINYGIGASYLDNDDCIYEVIGNIYENKELLND